MDVDSKNYRVYKFQKYAGKWRIGNGPELGAGHAWLTPDQCERAQGFIGFVGEKPRPVLAVFLKRIVDDAKAKGAR